MYWFVHRDAARWRERHATTPGLPDSRPEWFRQGTDAWIAQTWLRLAARGLPVGMAEDLVEGAICVVHHDHLRGLTRPWRSYVVAVRADHSPVHTAERSVVQNPRLARRHARERFLPHWPQPGLVPRTADAHRIRRVTYMGRPEQLLRGLQSPESTRELEKLGIELVAETERWWDYAETDVVVAIRQGLRPAYLATKPATKLVNAWLAGCPALLGYEPALRALRRGPLDYLEVRTVAGFLEAVRRLHGDPGLYRAMVANGRRRAASVGVEAVTDAWCAFLEEIQRVAWPRWRRTGERAPARARARHLVRWIVQGADRLRFRQTAFGSVLRRSPRHAP